MRSHGTQRAGHSIDGIKDHRAFIAHLLECYIIDRSRVSLLCTLSGDLKNPRMLPGPSVCYVLANLQSVYDIISRFVK